MNCAHLAKVVSTYNGEIDVTAIEMHLYLTIFCFDSKVCKITSRVQAKKCIKIILSENELVSLFFINLCNDH